MSNDKNEALIMALIIDNDGDEYLSVSRSEIAEMLRSQAAEIDSLRSEVLLKADYGRTTNTAYEHCIAERDQLKAKNAKLVDAVETVCEGFTLHPSARKILEAGLYGEALKENT